VRTTIHLDDGLLDDAKRRAAEEGTSFTQLLTRALRHELARPRRRPPVKPFRLVTYGAGGLVSGLTVERVQEVLEAEDAAGIVPAGSGSHGRSSRSSR
jgi:hypothetical protein